MSEQASSLPADVVLRDVSEGDLPVFFMHQRDAEANRMAAFTSADPSDEEAFYGHWGRILGNQSIKKRTIMYDDNVAGHIMVYPQSGELEVTYWIGRHHWGKGIATRALSQFLEEMSTRPLFARSAKDNLRSLRVLQKCGFVIVGHDQSFADGRGEVVEEHILRLGESTSSQR